MKTKLLLLVAILSLNFTVALFAQNVSILSGETTTIHSDKVYNGDFGPNNTGGSGFSCNYNKGRGIISVGFEIQSDGYASWDIAHIAFYYNGSWKSIAWFNNGDNQSGCDQTTYNANHYTTPIAGCTYGGGNYETHSAYSDYTKIGKMGGGFSDRYQNITMKNMGNLQVFHGNYLPQSGVILNRVKPADNNMWGIQTAVYTTTGKPYPAFNDPNPATKKPTGYDVGNYVQYGNLPGFIYDQYTGGIGTVILNIANLPPDMLESPNFKVHVYALSIGNNQNRIYETTYSNQNFMTNGPMSLVASQDQCTGVNLSWSNSSNVLPDDGNVTLKNVIFRNGAYLATVLGTATTYTDATAVQDVSYDYSVKHVAFSETGETYYRSPSSAIAAGYKKPRPDQAISQTASSTTCNGQINVGWSFNGSNPQYFRIDTSSSSSGPFVAMSSTITGSSRSYNHSGVIRGKRQYYRIYSINSCSVVSSTYAECNGISIADPALPTAVTATANSSYDTVTVSWADNANNETKYQVIRQDNLGNQVTFDVNPNVTSYKDNGIVACRDYSYTIKVFNDCVQSGLVSAAASTGIIPPPNLNATFNLTTKKLTCSKGYFSNRIELGWQNYNGQNIDLFKIYRKISGTSFDSTLVGTAGGGSGFYVDNTADARVYYKYTIVGIKFCNGTDVPSNLSEDIGFRNPTGVISGHIEYNGGIALTGAKVIIQPAGGATGKSLSFASGATLTLQTASTLTLTDELRLEFWFKPTSYAANQNIVDKAGVFSFKHIGSNYEAKVNVAGTTYTITVPEATFALNSWKHVSMQYAGSSNVFKLYANGVAVGNTVIPGGSVTNTSNQIVFGGVGSTFLLDEFRLIAKSTLDTNINIDHARFLNPNVNGAKISLRFDEGYGDYAYDGSSQSNVYNGNHFIKTSGATWSADIPTLSQLSYFGITNVLGNYNVEGILFSGTGENFTIIPSFLTHSFTPGSRAVYLGDASTVFNNQDFIDNSSFTVTGTLFYKNTTCPVPDGLLKIDGSAVISNGQQVVTDANGAFSIQVPIGQHYISVDRYEHYMQDGRFPVTGTHNFQEPITGIQFTDSTKRSIVGRVVGGLIETKKAPDMGRSKNNIGRAKIRIVSPISGLPCYTAEVITNALTGEYRFDVPPLEYRIDSVYVLGNKFVLTKAITPSPFTNSNQLVDLRNLLVTTKVVDTLFDDSGGVVSIDSSEFHKRHDMTYRIKPSINVTDTLGHLFIGEDSLKHGGTTFSIKPTGPGWGPFGFPVFQQGEKYAAKIYANEIYNNFDNSTKDTVRLSGNVLITNALVDGTDPNSTIPFTEGVATYRFTCGSPNTSTNGINPALNYTKSIQINVVPTGAATVVWEPNPSVTPKIYHAYVEGQRIAGTGIATLGPEKVDFILRDPPGSSSSSSWSTGTSVSIAKDYSKALSSETNVSATIKLGTEKSVGIGVETEIEIDNNVGLGISTVGTNASGHGWSETITSNYAVSTRDDADNVGAPADIFIGRSRNWLVGPTLNIELIDDSQCATVGGCFGAMVNGKRMVKKAGYAIAPADVKTRFSYTQNEIETVVIPTLESLRATKLAGPKYTSHVPSTDPRFGSNNDDPIWATAATTTTPDICEPADFSGPSYTYTGNVLTGSDTVRSMNTQISLWKKALARNEREKIQCITNTGGILLDNFSLGSAIVTNSYSTDREAHSSETWELSIGGDVNIQLGAVFGGIGAQFEESISITETSGGEESKSTTSSTSFEYTLSDGDPGDIMSIDVYKSPEGTGNIFVTRGGFTMCPYEDAVMSHYYNPANPSAYIGSHTYNEAGFSTIQLATVQREIPEISITPANQFSIPSDQPAVFQLLLTNQSPLTVNNDIDFAIRVASASNPYGAVIKIDGLTPSSTYNIPAGTSVVKTLTVERGPIEINYDSLMIIFSSACSEDIADTAYISAHFIPTCTNISMTSPSNNWVFNNAVNNTGNLITSNYNYNYGAAVDTSTTPDTQLGLNKIGLEMKPGNSSTWTEFKSFYKYPALGQDTIPSNQIYSQHLWDISDIPDGNYEIKAKSYCLNKDGSYSSVESPILAGVMDRINPHPFGTPSPGDGILDPNDDISIQFNESIDIGSLGSPNFDIRGVLNGTTVRHSESLNFNGSGNYAEVSAGANLQSRDFTFEFWAKLNATGIAQTVISQGSDASQHIYIGFNASNKLIFGLGSTSITSNSAIGTVNQWHHYAVVYNFNLETAALYVDGVIVNTGNQNIYGGYTGSGKLVFGKELPGNINYLNGNVHDIRLWSKTRTVGEITQNFTKDLNRSTSGLLYNWKMNEAEGAVATDYIRSRNADIVGATWEINPNGSAAQFDGVDDVIKIASSTIPILKEMDFTLEFWFNSTQSSVATLFSNGTGDGLGPDSLLSWNIQKDANGNIHVYHKGMDFVATSTNYFDGTWHHFALVMQRSANLSCYIDGNLQNSVQALSFEQMGGAKMYLGAKGYYVASVETFANYFNGTIDEFRFWNTSRKAEQIKRDKQYRLKGDEYGLQAFVPFEGYALVLGVPVLSSSFNNYSANTLAVTPFNGTAFISQTPTIKLPRPIQAVNYTWSLNNDKIIITPTSSPELLENVTLDITVKNAYDQRGNKMQSPKTWIAYMNKNQVKWAEQDFSINKLVSEIKTFDATIVNTGGALKSFTIGNIPDWLQPDITSGVISPNSTKIVHFTIDEMVNIGEFEEDIALTTDFNYPENLKIRLKVSAPAPTWTVDPAQFQYSQGLIGQVKIDGIISTNPDDKVGAFVGSECRGVTNLQYYPQYDKYFAVLDIYSNSTSPEVVTFRVWNAAQAKEHSDVTPTINFGADNIDGSFASPIFLEASDELNRTIPLHQGWNWVSVNVACNDSLNINAFMNSINATTGDIVKGQTAFADFSTTNNWTGSLANQGIKVEKSYRIKVAAADTLIFKGKQIDPTTRIIPINTGWNWIGFVSLRNLSVTEALGNLTPTNGDVIKGQSKFAVYDNVLGWAGSLATMQPDKGYMYKAASAATFTYPITGLYTKASEIQEQTYTTTWNVNANQFANSMSVIAKLDCANGQIAENITLGAFVGTECRGVSSISNTEALNGMFYLTVFSNLNSETVTYKLINETNGKAIDLDNTSIFTNNGIEGGIASPIQLSSSFTTDFCETIASVNSFDGGIASVIAKPNPFKDVLVLAVNLKTNSDVNVVIRNVTGQIVYSNSYNSVNKGTTEFNINFEREKMAAGVYSIEIRSNSEIHYLKAVKF
ncbi:MAG: LamG-like jellyroll fold domain-containing protein [Bacteroidota bacterium]